jgi:general secretion pathway protein I
VKGFTLLEIMIALAILAGTILTVICSFNYHLSVVDRDREETLAVLLARTKLDDPAFKRGEAAQGDFAPDWPGFSWETVIKPTDSPKVTRSIFTVSWHGEQRKISFVQYMAQSTGPKSGDAPVRAGKAGSNSETAAK